MKTQLPKLFVLLIVFLVVSSARAQETSRVIPFNNVATSLPASTTQNVTVQVWDAASGGTLVFSESQTGLAVDGSGNISFVLGSQTVSGLDPNNFPSGSSRYVDVLDITSTSVLAARIPLNAVAFALSPGPAGPPGAQGPKGDPGPQGAQGNPGAIQTIAGPDGTITVAGTPTDPTVALTIPLSRTVSSASSLVRFNNTGSGAGVEGANFGAGTGLLGSTPSGTGVRGSSGSGVGVFGDSTSSSGVRGISSTGTGVSATHTASTGTSPAIQGDTNSTDPFSAGVFGSAGSGYGVWGAATSGQGVRGVSNSGPGVQGVSSSGSGIQGSSSAGDGVVGQTSAGTAGVRGVSTATNGSGVVGIANNGAAAAGVSGSSTSGDGVVGLTSASTSTAGVRGTSTALSGNGVIGEADNGAAAYGVEGISSSGFAGYFLGNATVTGTLTKGGGAFKIDHPLHPAEKYLYHSFVESPDMKNIYDGVAVLNENGEAMIQLPEWFQALNRDFRYQLTCIGGYAPVYIAQEIQSNSFKIAGGAAGLKVSWQVTGIRQDAWANANRIPVEQDKAEEEQGHYIHPTLFGAPEEQGIEWVRRPELMQQIKAMRSNPRF